MFCEYAKEYISSAQKLGAKASLQDTVELSQQCCGVNQFYQILYPRPQQVVSQHLGGQEGSRSDDEGHCEQHSDHRQHGRNPVQGSYAES